MAKHWTERLEKTGGTARWVENTRSGNTRLQEVRNRSVYKAAAAESTAKSFPGPFRSRAGTQASCPLLPINSHSHSTHHFGWKLGRIPSIFLLGLYLHGQEMRKKKGRVCK
eukprot:TRINITY_DN21737_c0_g1_i1.p3 TRINITY_DN21737_c0_g1~~TRINITY_DN21737_c0_g1_i1.p3  ORF type:complete len:111 (-),score=14.25 TRINITY_DN21737_c0_g1_i1:40-372(-)